MARTDDHRLALGVALDAVAVIGFTNAQAGCEAESLEEGKGEVDPGEQVEALGHLGSLDQGIGAAHRPDRTLQIHEERGPSDSPAEQSELNRRRSLNHDVAPGGQRFFAVQDDVEGTHAAVVGQKEMGFLGGSGRREEVVGEGLAEPEVGHQAEVGDRPEAVAEAGVPDALQRGASLTQAVVDDPADQIQAARLGWAGPGR